MDITQLTETELKALAYDIILRIQQEQANLQIIQARLQELKAAKDGTQKD